MPTRELLTPAQRLRLDELPVDLDDRQIPGPLSGGGAGDPVLTDAGSRMSEEPQINIQTHLPK